MPHLLRTFKWVVWGRHVWLNAVFDGEVEFVPKLTYCCETFPNDPDPAAIIRTLVGGTVIRFLSQEFFERQAEHGLYVDNAWHDVAIHSCTAKLSVAGRALQVFFHPPRALDLMRWVVKERAEPPYPFIHKRHSRHHAGNACTYEDVPDPANPAERIEVAVPDEREHRARALIRRLVGPRRYKFLLKNGYVPVKAASGKTYHITMGQTHMHVFDPKGVHLEDVCLVLTDDNADQDYTDGDNFVAKYIALLDNEEEFNKKANHHPLPPPDTRIYRHREMYTDIRPLPLVFRQLKEMMNNQSDHITKVLRSADVTREEFLTQWEDDEFGRSRYYAMWRPYRF